MIDGTIFCAQGGANANLTWTDGSAVDEQGLMFTFPAAWTIDAIGFPIRLVDGTSDFQVDFVSTPTASQASLISGPLTQDAQNFGLAGVEGIYLLPIVPVTVAAGTNYGVVVKASGAGNIRFARAVLPAAASRSLFLPNGTNTLSITRNGGSGDYTAGSTSILNPCFVRVSNVPAGGGSAGMLFRAQGVIN